MVMVTVIFHVRPNIFVHFELCRIAIHDIVLEIVKFGDLPVFNFIPIGFLVLLNNCVQ